MKHRGYAICTQPRSGSNLLSQHLASTGHLGNPLEYFNGPARRALGLPNFPDTPEQQIDEILTLGTTANGIYAVKLFASQFEVVSNRVRWMDALPDLRLVYLSRDDLLGQAISWARALQTQQYRSTQPLLGEATYNSELIQAQLLVILRERALWEGYFARTGIQPVRILYERLVDAPHDAVQRIAELLDVALVNPEPASGFDLTVQRDELSMDWRRQFLTDCGDPNIL